MRNWIAILLAWLSLATSAFGENRVALVIGNDRYDNLSEAQQLHNAVNDARAMKKALERLNFQVDVGENLDRRQFVDKLSEFSGRLQAGDIAFFFYSGHGVSFSGSNYMLPRDIPAPRSSGPAEEKRLAALAVAENDALDDIRASEARVTVMVLDACRDNPLTPPGGKSLGGEKGLRPPPQPDGLLTIYSAGIGQTASDLGEGNSLFTGILVRELTTPGLGLRELAFKTQGEVAALAREHGLMQRPGVYSQIIGDDVYLFGSPETPSASDENLARMIDAATSADWLTPLIAGLSEGPLKERAKARAETLKKNANLPPEPPKPAPTTANAGSPKTPSDTVKPTEFSAFELTWRFLKTSTDSKALKAYLDSLPVDSPLRRDVEARIEEVRSSTTHDASLKPERPEQIPSPEPKPQFTVAPPLPVDAIKPKRLAPKTETPLAKASSGGRHCFTYLGERVCE